MTGATFLGRIDRSSGIGAFDDQGQKFFPAFDDHDKFAALPVLRRVATLVLVGEYDKLIGLIYDGVNDDAPWDLALARVANAVGAAGVQLEVVMELRSIPSILKMVATTGSLAFVSRLSLSAEPDLRAVPVRGLTISRTMGLATRHAMPLSAPAEAFAALLRRRPTAGSRR